MLSPRIRNGVALFRLAVGLSPAVLLVLGLAQAPAADQRAEKGEWGPVLAWPNVAVHAHVLPNGKVLFWGRREANEGLNPRDCTPRLWNPRTGEYKTTATRPGFNLFCSGHTFLPDGRVFVVGGHILDGKGEPHATIYDPSADTWTRIADTKGGRWYPTAVTLPDGGVLVSFGTDENGHNNITQQVWKDNAWRDIVTFDPPPYYPRMHVVPNGRVFMSGPLALTQFLDTSGGGSWTFLRPDPNVDVAVAQSSRINGFRDYAPSVIYDVGKILYIGGGNAPTKSAEILDLNESKPRWKKTGDMNLARRQHNATLLPDGTVLVTGGTKGNGGESNGFDDLTPGQPLRSAESWDPKTGRWTLLAKASVNRCYHSTAVLLPDATVLSAGGGEYSPRNDGNANKPEDTHKDAQVFSPPYLFRGAGRPDITAAPDSVTYGQTFTVGTSHPDQVGRVNWVRLSSVTHSFNTNQRINFLKFTANAGALSVTAPANANLCPPGHYMLFVLNKQNVPSVAKMIRIQ